MDIRKRLVNMYNIKCNVNCILVSLITVSCCFILNHLFYQTDIMSSDMFKCGDSAELSLTKTHFISICVNNFSRKYEKETQTFFECILKSKVSLIFDRQNKIIYYLYYML